MILYELTHLYFCHNDELVYSPKKLGLYFSCESTKKAIRFFSTLPGFCDNLDAFSVRERLVYGDVIDNALFEAVIYLHSDNYNFELEIELGLYGNKKLAESKLIDYIRENTKLVNSQNLIFESFVNKCIIERKEWTEGFSIYE